MLADAYHHHHRFYRLSSSSASQSLLASARPSDASIASQSGVTDAPSLGGGRLSDGSATAPLGQSGDSGGGGDDEDDDDPAMCPDIIQCVRKTR